MSNIILLQKPEFSSDTFLEPTLVSTWVKFVKAGEERAGCNLSEDLESFLVFTLIRFMERTDLFSVTLALEYYKASAEYTGQKKEQALSEVGDISLILSGLFPERVKRLNVSKSYFSEMGRMAFLVLADSFAQRRLHRIEGLYRNIHNGFPAMTGVLYAAREKKFGEHMGWKQQRQLIL